MAGILGRKGAEWERVKAQVLDGATVCQMPDCKFPGVPLNRDDVVNGRPGQTYPTVDHLVPVSKTVGWSKSDRRAALHDPRYCRPAHNACNASRGNRRSQRARERHSRDWGI